MDLRGLGAVQKSSFSKAAASFARGAYFQYVSTENWRERRWRLFSTAPLQIPINTETPVVSEFAGINTNMNNELDVSNFGLHSPDNLASDNAGNLYIVEAHSSKSDVWVATKDHNQDGSADNVYLFTTLNSLGAEGTGVYFPRTKPKTMFINVQHAADGNDMTIVVTKD